MRAGLCSRGCACLYEALFLVFFRIQATIGLTSIIQVCSVTLCVYVSARESDREEEDMSKGQHTSTCPHSCRERERDREREERSE